MDILERRGNIQVFYGNRSIFIIVGNLDTSLSQKSLLGVDGFGNNPWLVDDKGNFELTILFDNYPNRIDITFVWKTVCGIEMGQKKENLLELWIRRSF